MKKTHFLAVAVILMSMADIASSQPGDDQKIYMEGFDPAASKKAVYMDEYTNYEKKQVPALWEYPLDGNLSVSWTTPIVQASLKGRPVAFVIQAGFGASKGSGGWHELSVNGENILRFNTPYNEKNEWQGKGCSLSFHTLWVDENNDMTGVMHIEISPEHIKYGQPQTFTIRGENNNSKSWFMLFEGNATGINIESLQQKNEVRKRIISIKSVSVPPDASVEYVAKWRGMKSAARSASIAQVQSPDVVNVVVSGKTEGDIRKEIEAAIAGQLWINEVYPDQKSLQDIPSEHSEWLKKLDCVLWLSEPEKIQRYVELRKNLKASLVRKDETRLLVTLSPANKIPVEGTVTLQIPLPKETWNAEVFINGAKTAAGFIYIKDDKGISFDLEAGENAEIHIDK
ncbi:MAG: hypothetical protein WCS96_06985 [Victivallales bacterium]